MVGRYRLEGVLGEGGMGAAWLAHDERMRRDVVLKQLKLPLSLDSGLREQLVARMEREAQAAGMLKHPNIVTVHDRFHDEDDLPWIVMEFVQGPSLADLMGREGPLGERETARIGAHVADALAAAHGRGIVHRDVKPANIMLEGDRTVVTDFGIAAVSGELTLTPDGAILGTPTYMAPEQINDREAGPASDVWSLGATLYAAVEGRPPFTGSTTAALLLAVSRGTPAPTVRADLLKRLLDDLMRIDPARRPSAAETAAELRRIADHTPVSWPASPTTRAPATAGGLVTRRRLIAGLAAAGAVAAVPVILSIGGDDEKDPEAAPEPTRWDHPVSMGPPLAGHTDKLRSVAFSPDGTTLVTAADDGATRFWDVASREPVGPSLPYQEEDLLSVTFSPDGKVLATAGADKTVRLWDVAARTQIGEALTGHTESINVVTYSRDGRSLATCSDDKSVRLWDPAARTQTGRPMTGHTAKVWSVGFSPDGKVLATGSADKSVRLWDVTTRAQIGKPLTGHTDEVFSVVFSPDGKILATTGRDETVRLWDVASRTQIGKPLTGHINAVAFATFDPADGVTLATTDLAGSVLLWDVAARALVGQLLLVHKDGAETAAFSPDGRILATAGRDKTTRLWRRGPLR